MILEPIEPYTGTVGMKPFSSKSEEIFVITIEQLDELKKYRDSLESLISEPQYERIEKWKLFDEFNKVNLFIQEFKDVLTNQNINQ